jgi:hypothetical protein
VRTAFAENESRDLGHPIRFGKVGGNHHMTTGATRKGRACAASSQRKITTGIPAVIF